MEKVKGLRAIRERKQRGYERYKVSAIAEAVGVSPKTVYAWEKSPKGVPVEYARGVANYLGCKPEQLIFLPEEGN